MYQSVGDPKIVRKEKKPPGFVVEAAFCSVTLFLIKIYSDEMYEAISYVTVLIPMMIYFVLSIMYQMFKFIKLLHIESDEDDDSILSPKQMKLMWGVVRNMAGYFGLYMLSGELDDHIQQKELASINLTQGVVAIQIAFLIQMYSNWSKRCEYAKSQGNESAGFLGATGLATIFNALTQTATTVCANGQCFTISANAFSGNLAAVGVSVSSINYYLIPLCCCLLTYAIWSVYRVKRSCTYKPFWMALIGAALIIFDNFIFGENLQLHNIPSWIGNIMLIVGVIWSSKDSAKEESSPFDV